MKVRPYKIEMNYKGQVPDKVFVKRLKKAIDKGNFEVIVRSPQA